MPPITCFYLDLYNARTEDDLYQLMYAHAGAITRAANLLRKVFPDWLKATTLHWQRYKRFVERWVRDELAEDDWRLLSDWLGSDVRNILECVVPREGAPRWSLAGWLITAFKTNPNEPFTEAYREIAEHMIRMRVSGAIRPRFCTVCGLLFDTERISQQYCSPRCRRRIQQRHLRARRKETHGDPRQPGAKGKE